jgi:hypothetical protein
MMKSVVLGATVLGVVGTMAPAMAASSLGDTHHGGCFFNTDENAVATNSQNQGVIGDLSVTVDGNNQPTGADVTCTITVNGIPQVSKTYSGNPVQAGSDQVVFTASDTDAVQLCQTITYADHSTESSCGDATSQQIPPQQVIDALNGIFDTLTAFEISTVDPIVCPVLVTLHGVTGGGVPGVVEIHADGDVYVADPLSLGINPVYDCPPYLPTP